MARGQLTLEFMLTHGWVVFIVLISISAVAYANIHKPIDYVPEKCELNGGVYCLDHGANYDSISVVLRNSIGHALESIALNVRGTGCFVAADGPSKLRNGEQGKYTAYCNPGSGKFKGDIEISYVRSDSQLEHVKRGEIIVDVP